jgi:SSS family solute:Na+ symporter
MVLGVLTWVIARQLDLSWPSLIPAVLVSILAMVGGSLFWKDKEVKHGKN